MMTRNKYLKELRSFLGKLPKEDRKRILEFYNELIDDKLEAGQSEERKFSGNLVLRRSWRSKIFQEQRPNLFPAQYHLKDYANQRHRSGQPHLALAAGGIPGFSVRAVFSFVGGRGFLLVLRFRVWHSGNRRGCRLHSDAVFSPASRRRPFSSWAFPWPQEAWGF